MRVDVGRLVLYLVLCVLQAVLRERPISGHPWIIVVYRDEYMVRYIVSVVSRMGKGGRTPGAWVILLVLLYIQPVGIFQQQ